jgi:hypothetical protein
MVMLAVIRTGLRRAPPLARTLRFSIEWTGVIIERPEAKRPIFPELAAH